MGSNEAYEYHIKVIQERVTAPLSQFERLGRVAILEPPVPTELSLSPLKTIAAVICTQRGEQK